MERATRERERERKLPRVGGEWILMQDSKYIGATRGKEGKGKITPWSRCDRTGRVSARHAVFTRHQIGSNLSTYQTFRFHPATYRYFLAQARRQKRKKSPLSVRRIVRRIKCRRQGSAANCGVIENSCIIAREEKTSVPSRPISLLGY